MSDETKSTDLNLELAFLPAWAQQSPEINRYANYEGDRGESRGGWGKGPRRDRPFGGGRSQTDRPRGDRPRSPRPPGRDQRRDDRGPREQGDRFGKGGFRPGRPAFEKRPELPPIGVDINLVPEAQGVDSLTKQIRITGRAYPLFDVARLVLQKDERFGVELRIKKLAEGGEPQPLFACALDDTVWLGEEEAVQHVLENHLATFYQVEKVPTEPPKGTYTFVAQCGMSGAVLGPPNYHDYQNKLHKLHQERFASMPFERFKSRVKIVRDEAVVKKWLEEQSFKTAYTALNVPEPLKFERWDEVRAHFQQVHAPNIIKRVERQVIPAERARRAGSRDLQRHVVQEIEQQRRFPLKVVTTLSQQFAARGLQFFKVNKNVVHVAVARPHFLDVDAEPISPGVKRIVQFVNEHPRCTVKKLVEALAPTPTPAPTAPSAVEPAAEGTAPTPAAPVHHEPTDAQKTVLSDLHWLVHSGHVIEFANGELETAKKPLPKPPPTPKKPAVAKPPAPAAASLTAAVTPSPVESAPAATPVAIANEPAGTSEPSTPGVTSESAVMDNRPVEAPANDPTSSPQPG